MLLHKNKSVTGWRLNQDQATAHLKSLVSALFSLATKKPMRLSNRTFLFFLTEPPKDVSVDLDSDHDYEDVDETLVNVVRKAQDNILYS